MEQVLRVRFEDVFPDEHQYDLNYYISNIDRTSLLRAASLLVSISKDDSSWSNWRNLIYNKWFSSSNIYYINYISDKLEKLEHKLNSKYIDRPSFSIVNSLGALQLLEFVSSIDFVESDRSYDTDKFEINLFKALLVVNSLQEKIQDENQDEITDEGSLNIDAMYIVYGLAQGEVANITDFELYKNLAVQLYKSFELFSFLKEYNFYLLNSFLSKYSCSDSLDYYDMIAPIISKCTKKKTSLDDDYFSIDNSNHVLINFVDNFIISPGKVKEDVDFRNIRSSPILRISDYNYIIMSQIFMIQKLYNGLYFELKDINDNSLDNKISNFRSYFTSNFSEKFLLYKILDSIYGKRSYIKLSGDYIKTKYNCNGEPDYYIRNGNTIFLFENKDIFIASEVKVSYSYVRIIEEIEKKIGKDRGINQILNSIEYLTGSDCKYDSLPRGKMSFYPILVVHNNELVSLGINKYFNNKFINKLNERSLNEKYKIHELTIIHIDVFILFERLFRDKKFILDEAIDMYHEFIKRPGPKIRDLKTHKKVEERNYWSFTEFLISIYSRKKGVHVMKEMGNVVSRQTSKYLRR